MFVGSYGHLHVEAPGSHGYNITLQGSTNISKGNHVLNTGKNMNANILLARVTPQTWSYCHFLLRINSYCQYLLLVITMTTMHRTEESNCLSNHSMMTPVIRYLTQIQNVYQIYREKNWNTSMHPPPLLYCGSTSCRPFPTHPVRWKDKGGMDNW